MDRKKKLLYMMGIDWNWIFQRPQIIEQHLEENYDVTVVFPRSILKAFVRTHVKYPFKYKILWNLPLQEKNRFIGWVASLYSERIFRKIEQYDLIVIGYPLYFRYVPDSYKGKVIYDCMDNYEALYPDSKNAFKVAEWEKKLVSRSDLVIVTANKLFHKIRGMMPDKEIVLIRNGTKDKVINEPFEPKIQQTYKIGYFGTIAEWFDFDLITKSLEKIQDIEYHLIGPMTKPYEQEQQRIIFEGIVPHQKLCEVTKDYSCFIMPFIVNDIVEWVDPVKLYEYISLGKCIISVRYPEIERFADYVYMYSDSAEFLRILQELKQKGFPPRYNSRQQVAFLAENSWDKRFEMLDALIYDLLQNEDKHRNTVADI